MKRIEDMTKSELQAIELEERFGKKTHWTSEMVYRYVKSQERIADLLEELVAKIGRASGI